MKKNPIDSFFFLFFQKSGLVAWSFFLAIPFSLWADSHAKDQATIKALSRIDASYNWIYKSDQPRIEGMSQYKDMIQIPFPQSLSSAPKIYFSRPYLFVVAKHQQAFGWLPFISSDLEGWDLWVYAFTESRWYRVQQAFPDTSLDWINLTYIDQTCLCDVLEQDPDLALARKWVRYWIEWKTQQVHSSVIRKGKIDQILVFPNPTTGIFRYAYLLESGNRLIKYDLVRSHEKELKLPFQAQALHLEKPPTSTREDHLLIHVKGHEGIKTLQGLDLSIQPETPLRSTK